MAAISREFGKSIDWLLTGEEKKNSRTSGYETCMRWIQITVNEARIRPVSYGRCVSGCA